MNFRGKAALVTGASQGIGRGCAVELGRGGVNVAVNYNSNRDKAEETAEMIRQLGAKAFTIQTDVSDQPAVEAMVARTVEEFGRLDYFVSNAVYSDRQLMIEADMDGFRKTINVSMWGAFHGVRAAAQQMVKQGDRGAICVVSSPHAEIPFPTAMAYNMAKAAIDQMARTAAIELSSHGIRVNIVHPGWIDTPGERKFFTEDQLAAGAEALPFGRLGSIDEVGKSVAFVLSDEADYMTGSTLTLDGGVKLPWWSKRSEGGQ